MKINGINNTTLKNYNNNLNGVKNRNNNNNYQLLKRTTFKGNNLSLSEVIEYQNRKSFLGRLFSFLKQKPVETLVKKVHKNLQYTQDNKLKSNETKFYYKNRKDGLISITFSDCVMDQTKKNIEKASKIVYHYDNKLSGGLKQKVFSNPIFDNKGNIKHSEFVQLYLDENSGKEKFIIHNNVLFKDNNMFSSDYSEIIYKDNSFKAFKKNIFDENGQIKEFEEMEKTCEYKDGTKNITEKTYYKDNQTKPVFFIKIEKENEKEEKRLYIENPEFREDNTLKSASLSQIIEGNVIYTDYQAQYNENGVLSKSKLHKISKKNKDCSIGEKEREYKQRQISNLIEKETKEFNEVKMLKQQLSQKLNEQNLIKQRQNKLSLKDEQTLINKEEDVISYKKHPKKIRLTRKDINFLNKNKNLDVNELQDEIRNLQEEINVKETKRMKYLTELRLKQKELRELEAGDIIYMNYNNETNSYSNKVTNSKQVEEMFEFKNKGLIKNGK